MSASAGINIDCECECRVYTQITGNVQNHIRSWLEYLNGIGIYEWPYHSLFKNYALGLEVSSLWSKNRKIEFLKNESKICILVTRQ